jgi:hypothetical protein
MSETSSIRVKYASGCCLPYLNIPQTYQKCLCSSTNGNTTIKRNVNLLFARTLCFCRCIFCSFSIPVNEVRKTPNGTIGDSRGTLHPSTTTQKTYYRTLHPHKHPETHAHSHIRQCLYSIGWTFSHHPPAMHRTALSPVHTPILARSMETGQKNATYLGITRVKRRIQYD